MDRRVFVGGKANGGTSGSRSESESETGAKSSANGPKPRDLPVGRVNDP